MKRELYKNLSGILQEIVDSRITFHAANNLVAKLDCAPEDKKLSVSYLGAVLRNYISLSAVADSSFSRLPKGLRTYLLLGMVIIRFGKNEKEKDEVKQLLEDEFRVFELENFLPSLKNLLSFLSTSLKLIPSNVVAHSPEYFACTYNIPVPLVKMWIKQYGFPITIRSSSALNRRPPNIYRINTNRESQENIIAASNGAIRATDRLNIVNYESKLPFRKSVFHADAVLFKTESVVFDAIQKLPFEQNDTLLYIADETVVPYEAFLAFQEKKGKGLDVLASSDEIKYPLLQKSNALRNQKQYVRVSPFDGLAAHLHKKYQNILFVPKSTKFNDIASRPELLIQLDLSLLEPYTKAQMEGILAISEYVEENGILTYMIPTMSKKESSRIVQDFLSQRPEFRLIEEVQHYPFEKGGAILYYAILKREPADGAV